MTMTLTRKTTNTRRKRKKRYTNKKDRLGSTENTNKRHIRWRKRKKERKNTLERTRQRQSKTQCIAPADAVLIPTHSPPPPRPLSANDTYMVKVMSSYVLIPTVSDLKTVKERGVDDIMNLDEMYKFCMRNKRLSSKQIIVKLMDERIIKGSFIYCQYRVLGTKCDMLDIQFFPTPFTNLMEWQGVLYSPQSGFRLITFSPMQGLAA